MQAMRKVRSVMHALRSGAIRRAAVRGGWNLPTQTARPTYAVRTLGGWARDNGLVAGGGGSGDVGGGGGLPQDDQPDPEGPTYDDAVALAIVIVLSAVVAWIVPRLSSDAGSKGAAAKGAAKYLSNSVF